MFIQKVCTKDFYFMIFLFYVQIFHEYVQVAK